MGTNYYWHPKEKRCPECDTLLSNESIHIGKASAGWRFSFHALHPSETSDLPIHEIRSFNDWLLLFAGMRGEIRDEYDVVFTTEQFMKMVHDKHKDSHSMVGEIQDMYRAWFDEEGHSFMYGEFS